MEGGSDKQYKSVPAYRLSRSRGTRQTICSRERAYRPLLAIFAISYGSLGFPVKLTQFYCMLVLCFYGGSQPTYGYWDNSAAVKSASWTAIPSRATMHHICSLDAHIMRLNARSSPTDSSLHFEVYMGYSMQNCYFYRSWGPFTIKLTRSFQRYPGVGVFLAGCKAGLILERWSLSASALLNRMSSFPSLSLFLPFDIVFEVVSFAFFVSQFFSPAPFDHFFNFFCPLLSRDHQLDY